MKRRFYKKFTTRKRSYRKRRTMNISRPVRALSQGVCNMKRTVYQGSWQFNTVSTDGFWRYLTFTPLTATSDWSDIQRLFDEYKINGVKFTFRPRYDGVDANPTTLSLPTSYAHYCVDPGSTYVPSGLYTANNLNIFLQNDKVKTRSLQKPFSIYFKPKVTDSVSGGSTAARAVNPGWIRTTEDTVSFRGAHVFLQENNMTANTNLFLDIFITLYMQVRNLR